MLIIAIYAIYTLRSNTLYTYTITITMRVKPEYAALPRFLQDNVGAPRIDKFHLYIEGEFTYQHDDNGRDRFREFMRYLPARGNGLFTSKGFDRKLFLPYLSIQDRKSTR